MDGLVATAEEVLARIATRRHGVVTRIELLGAGLSAQQIDDRIRKGLLIREHPGVYRVGHRAPNTLSLYLAAVRACGDDGVLIERPAAHLLRLIKGSPPAPVVMSTGRRRLRGVRTKRARVIDPRDVTRVHGIPVTTVPRTLVDLAAVLSVDDLARACHEAGVLYDTTPRQVREVLARRPNAPGAAKLRLVMEGDAPVMLSRMEKRFRGRLVDAKLPLPLTNRPAGAHYVDCRWPDHHLTVELNSYHFHNSRRSWEQDYERRRAARARRDEFRTYTWADVFEDPAPMLAELEELLSRAARPLRG